VFAKKRSARLEGYLAMCRSKDESDLLRKNPLLGTPEYEEAKKAMNGPGCEEHAHTVTVVAEVPMRCTAYTTMGSRAGERIKAERGPLLTASRKVICERRHTTMPRTEDDDLH